MTNEKIERLERSHMARRKIYDCAAPKKGHARELMKDVRRRYLRQSGAKLQVVPSEGGAK